ncbi:MAG: hypothetical protein AAGH15_16100 [Myxococcota bacterium]
MSPAPEGPSEGTPPSHRRPGRVSTALALVCATFAAACETDGSSPPPGRLFFPTAMALAPDGTHLFVASSNFDLSFNRGALHSYDLDVLNASVDRCPERIATEETVDSPEECQFIPTQDGRIELVEQGAVEQVAGLLVSQVQIGSFTDGVAVAPAGNRLYLPVRGDANLTFVDIQDGGALFCGEGTGAVAGPDAFERCESVYSRVDESFANARDVNLPNDPVGVTTGLIQDLLPAESEALAGDYVLFAHRGGSVSLFFDRDRDGNPASLEPPRLVDRLDGIGQLLIDVSVDPATQFGWLASQSTIGVQRFGIGIEELTSTDEDAIFAQLERTSLYRTTTLFFAGLDAASGFGDVRSVAFDPRPDVDRAYLLNRSPNALLIADPSAEPDELRVLRRIPVGLGPSKLQVREFPVEGRTLAFVSCFDSVDVWVIDVDLGVLVGIVRNLGGPFEIEVDVPRRRAYVLDFVASTVRVVDLAPMLACLSGEAAGDPMADGECSPRLLGILGRPQARDELN